MVAALLLGGLGLIATSQTQEFSPGDPGLPMDARLVEQPDDQEAALNQRRQPKPCLGRSFLATSPVFNRDNLRHHWLILV